MGSAKCRWCGNQFEATHNDYFYCSNRCKSAFQADRDKKSEPKVVEKIIEKVVYVKPKTAEELNWERQDRENNRIKNEYMKESLRKLKKERLAEEEIENAKAEVGERRWGILAVTFLTITTNFILFKDKFDLQMFLMLNGFFGIYYIYFFFHKQIKKIFDWLDNK